MGDWVSMIKDVGFPIVVTLYLLYRIEGKLDELNTSIQQLPGLLKDLKPSLTQEEPIRKQEVAAK